jgi:folate-binding protein YgfZ
MSDKAFFEISTERAVLGVGGADRATFLQGLISNDTARIGDGRAIFAALLTPQGKFAFDLMLVGNGERYLIDAEAGRRADLLKRLKMFKLRSQVTLDDLDAEFAVVHLLGGDVLNRLGLGAEPGHAKPLAGGVVFVDPRLPSLGARAFLPRAGAEQTLRELGFEAAAPGTFRQHRYCLGVPEGSTDLIPDKSILLECGFDEMNGIDWQKGCYMGQELTARTKYRGLVRKRLLPVHFDGAALAPGTILTLDGKEAGEIRAAEGHRGLALIRLENLAAAAKGIDIGNTIVTASVPAWMKLPEPEKSSA